MFSLISGWPVASFALQATNAADLLWESWPLAILAWAATAARAVFADARRESGDA
jgi:hypothetical protein